MNISIADYVDPPKQPTNLQEEPFLGEFQQEGYTVFKTYLPQDGPHLRLYYRKYTPKKSIASLCIVHGFGEHSGRFVHIAQHFVKKGYEVHLMDLRGFGYSGGARGTATLDKLLKDLALLVSQVNTQLPLFLYGHSMGGLVVLSFGLLNRHLEISGIIATSPLIGLPADRNLNWFKIKLLTSVSKNLEDLVMNSMVNPTALTKNNQYLQSAFGDRLMLPFLGMHMGASILNATMDIKSHAHLFNKPVLILHGKEDSVTNYRDSIYFYEKCCSIEKGLKLFEQGYHELQHDEEYEELRNVVTDWLQRRTETAKPLGALRDLVFFYPKKKQTLTLKTKLLVMVAGLIYLYLIMRFKNHVQFKNSKLQQLLIPFLLLVRRQ